jgi:SOS-response transcriptional repressor LexA
MQQSERQTLSQVLLKLMKEVGVSEAKLARKTDIPQPTLHRILSGSTKSPRGSSLAPLANFFSVTINQLMGADELPTDRVAGTHNSRIYGWTPVPLISWTEANKWQQFEKVLRSHKWGEWVSTDLSVSGKTFAMTVQGDAMAPTFIEGTTLIIDPEATINNRDFVIIKSDTSKSASFRQLLTDGDDKYLKSINDEFRTIQADNDKTTIIGKLVQARTDFHCETEDKAEVQAA